MKKTEIYFFFRTLWIGIVLILSFEVNATTPAQISDDHTATKLGHHMDFLIDTEGTINFEDVRDLEELTEKPVEKVTGKWQPVSADNIIAGFTSDVYWVRFTVENASPQYTPWVLEINYSILDKIELYAPDADGNFVKTIAGDHLPFEQRPIEYRNFAFPMDAPAGSVLTYYMRFETESAMNINLNMWPGNSFVESADGKLYLYGFLYGIVFLSSIYCLMNAVFLRHRMYLFIALSIFGSMGYLLGINGFAFQYLWPNSLWLQSVAIPFFMNVCFGFALLYSREFLDLERTSPRSDKVIAAFATICLILGVSSLFASYAIVIRISTVFAIVTAFATFWAGMISFMRGNKSARFFLMGWMAMIIGATTFALKSLALLPANAFTIWGQEYGFAGIAIFLTLALSDHFFQAQRKHDAQQTASMNALKSAEKKYRSLFENAIEGIFQLDHDGRLINANSAFAQILGSQDVDALLEKNLAPYSLNCLSDDDRSTFIALLESDQTTTNFETRIELDSGEERWISISAQEIKSQKSGASHYEGAMADITETKKREKAEKQQRMAEASTEAKSLFLANMSHEIRTPMNAIIGFTDLALGRNKDLQLADFLQKIRMASTNLLGIINDILDFSKIEAGKLEIEHTPFRVEEVLSNLRNIVSGSIESKNLSLNIVVDEDIPDLLVGDPLRLGQVLLNLTNNAIKFTSQGEVTVELELVSLNKPELSIELSGRVRDTGIGIAPDKLKNLFSSFTQADESTTRRFGGTGLGLSISKQLIEMMGGRMHVESVVDEGSVFSFNLSCKLQDRRHRSKPQFTQHLPKLKVLVVDDQEESRDIIEKALISLAHSATCVSSSEEAIAELKRQQKIDQEYDVLIADWLMPDMDGIACCENVKQDPKINTPRTILITGYDQDEARTRAEQAGIDAYMLKPLNVDELSNTLQEIFKDRRTHQQANSQSMVSEAQFDELKVLLVEDVPLNQELATQILTKKGIEVTVANNGQEGVEAVQSGQFDMVLMDMQMPVMDGCQATEAIRSFNKDLPVVAMTANAMTGDKNRCLASGMNDYITKPINPDELFRAIARWTNIDDMETSSSLDPEEALEENSISESTDLIGNSDADANNDIEAIDLEQALLEGDELEHQAPSYDEDTEDAQSEREENHKPKAELASYLDQLTGISQTETTQAETTQQDDLEAAGDNQEGQMGQSKNLPGLDVADGLNRCQDNLELYLRFLNDFKRDYADTPTQLRLLFEQDNFSELNALGHRIKGLAGNLGAIPVAQAAAALEQSSMLTPGAMEDAINQYQSQLNSLLSSIEKINEDHVGVEADVSKPIDQFETSELSSRLSELLKLIDQQKFDAHDMAIEIKARWPITDHDEELEKLVSALDSFDFKQAGQLAYAVQTSLNN